MDFDLVKSVSFWLITLNFEEGLSELEEFQGLETI